MCQEKENRVREKKKKACEKKNLEELKETNQKNNTAN